MKKYIGIIISLVLIIWACTLVNWSEVLQELSHVRYQVLFISLLIMLGHFLLRAYRWRFLLVDCSAPFRDLFDAIMLGNFASYILPFRAGELVRPGVLAQRNNYSFAPAFASVVIERLFDLIAVLFSFGILLTFIESVPDWAMAGAWSLSVLAVAILVFLLIGIFLPDTARKISGVFLGIFPEKIQKPLQAFEDGLLSGVSVLKSGKKLFMIIFLTVFVWLSNFFLFCQFLTMFPEAPGMITGFVTAVVLALAVAAPSAPGFIGVYQTGSIAGFVMTGASAESAMTFAIVTHVFQYIVYVIYGVFLLFRYNFSLQDLRSSGRSPASSSL